MTGSGADDASKRGTTIHGFRVHPAAEIYPLMSGEQWKAFVDSVRESMTVHEAIIFHEGMILEGRHRMKAIEEILKETGIEPTWRREEFDVSSGELLADFVARKNSHRRHMNEDQRAVSAVKIHRAREQELSDRRQKESRFGSEAQNDNAPLPINDPAAATPDLGSPSEAPQTGQRKRNRTTAERIADKGGVKKHRIEKALKLQKEKGEAALDKVLNGELSLSKALDSTKPNVAERPLPEQVARAWEAMKKKFVVADYPELRRELQKLLKSEMGSNAAPTSKKKLELKQPRPFSINGMGFIQGRPA